jgi:serine/threonine protein kinase
MVNVNDSAMTAQATEGETNCSCATACSPSSKNVGSKGSKHVRFSFDRGPNQTPRDDTQGTLEQSITPTQETKVKASSTNGITSARSILSGSPAQAITFSNQDDPINSSWSSASLSTGSRLCGAPLKVEVPEGRDSYEFVFSGDSATSSASKVSRFPAFSAYTGLNSITLEINDASRIARGKSGMIYQAKSGVSKLVVKVVNRPISKSASTRFERELVQLQNLPEHPCVVRHHGYMALGDARKIGVITDLVIGSETWHTRLHNTFLSLDDEGKHLILLQILDAVAFLHSHDVTHRDLSLHHVLHVYGSSSEVIKLIDFGLPTLRAATTSSGSRSAARDWADDHPHYASPEVLRGDLSAHDNDGWKKSDIFSFAVLMAELLIEELPWEGESAKYVINAVNQRGERAFQVGDVRLFGRKSPELEAIIERAWHKDPATRPTAEDLRKSLGALFSRPQNSDFKEPAQGSPHCASGAEVAEEPKAGTATFYSSHFQFSFAPPQESRAAEAFMPTFAFGASSKPQAPPISSLDAPGFGVSSPGAHLATPSVAKPASSFSSFASATQPEFGSQSLPKSSSFFDLFSGSSSSKPDLSSLMLTISDKTRVAEGNRGATYRGTCHTREVAVKVVSKPKTHSACSRLDKEARALKELPDHPSLVRYHGSIPIGDGRQMGIVTDFVFAGVAIDTRLHRTPHWLKEEDKHRMLIQVIDAVAFLHAHGITHRDLSWKHVLKTYESTSVIKLVDFGLPTLRSTTAGNPSSCTSFDMMGFTLEYASPEALRGELSNREDEDWELSNGGWPEKKDCPRGGKPGWRESDVYSFATLMVEMLLEERPWEAESPMHVINAVAKQGRRPFKVERVRLFGEKSPTLEALIHEAWHENPLKRPSALELKTRLERLFRSD